MSLDDITTLYHIIISNNDDDPPIQFTLDNIPEYIQAEGVKTSEDKRWASILHVMALSSILGRKIRSVYPDIQWNYRELYNTIIEPTGNKSFRYPEHYNISPETITIFWTRDGSLNQTDHMFIPNHIVPLFPSELHADSVIEIVSTPKKRKTQTKLDSFLGISRTRMPANTETTYPANIPNDPAEMSSTNASCLTYDQRLPTSFSTNPISPDLSSGISPDERSFFTLGVCPDLATLVSKREHLSDEEKFNILNFNIRPPSKYPSDKGRKYNIVWESNFSWLRYSVSENRVLCASCFVFGQTDAKHAEFSCKPFKDWKNAVGNKRGMLPNHAKSKTHINATTASVMFLNVCKGTKKSIYCSLSSAYSNRISEN